MLTLVLVVTAVSCSPVPSEPSFPPSIARHGTSPAGAAPVEATHEARQVTFDVIEGVGDTTPSTTSSDLSGEDDPPIPTATTPPVLPESEPQETNSAVTEPHHTHLQQHEAHPHLSYGVSLVTQFHESPDTHPHASSPHSQATPHHESQSSSSHASSAHRHASDPEVIQPDDSSSGFRQAHNPEPKVTQVHVEHPESTLSIEKGSEDTLPLRIIEQDGKPGNSRIEKPISIQPSDKNSSHDASAHRESFESSPQVRDDETKVQNNKTTSEVSHTSLHHHNNDKGETVVEADLHSWETTTHRHFSSPVVKNETQDGNSTDGLQRNKGVVIKGNNETTHSKGDVRVATPVGHSLEQTEELNSDTQNGKVEYVDTAVLSIDTEEDTMDEIVVERPQQQSRIQVSIAEERVQRPPIPETNIGEPSNKNQTHDHSAISERKYSGEVEVLPSLVMDSSSPIDIVERSEEAEKKVQEAASESVVETSPQEASRTLPETPAEESNRRSRIYMKSSSEDETPDDITVEDPKTHGQKESENPGGSKVMGGLESMSMTSPTPDTPQEGGTRTPQDPEVTIVSSEAVKENTNATEPEGMVEGKELSPVSVPSAVPPITEDYTDNYNDPISTGNLPDLVVTQEEIPSSREHPQTDLPLLSTSDTEASGNFRKKGGTVWALPPQQEQVSAVAPTSLTPGCIVAIVFGVIVSVILVLGIGGFVVWQRRPLNRPKVLGSDRGYAGSDSGGYIDDQVRVSYVNSQIDSPKGTGGQASQSPQGEQVPQVLIHLRSLKPSLPKGLGKNFPKVLSSLPKVAPLNLPNIGQFIPKWESRGSNQSGQ